MKMIRFMFAALLLVASATAAFAEGSAAAAQPAAQKWRWFHVESAVATPP